MRTETQDSTFLYHGPCEVCGSSDARAHYSDGHSYCFVCGEPYSEERKGGNLNKKGGGRISKLIQGGAIRGITARRITEQTCRHFGYKVAKFKGKPVQVAPYYNDDNELVAQKVRFKDKDFLWLGSARQDRVLPFGAHAFQRTGKKITVTEGEIDALAMSQAQGNKWPTVSIPTGAGPQVKKYFARQKEYFNGFDEVVLMFDQDPAGQEAARAAAEILGQRAKIAKLPLKDPAEMLAEGRTDDLIDAMWRAKKYRPESLVDLSDLKESVLTPPKWGLSWPFRSLTKATYGIRLGELYALGAGTGIGKTDFFTQTMSHMVQEHDEKIAAFALEQDPGETATRLLGKLAGKAFHIPDGEWEDEEKEDAWENHVQEGKVFFYDSFGINDWESIKAKIEFLRDAEGVRYFFLDHLTALAAGMTDERKALDKMMADLGSLVKEKPLITICFISHLATPKGKPHEEGGRVMIRHFRGARSIGFWSHFMFGMERDQQAENKQVRSTTTFRILKDRYTGRSTGQVFYLGYDHETGMLYETSAPPDVTAEDFGFEDTLSETDKEGDSDF